jgi:hypothetical protein
MSENEKSNKVDNNELNKVQEISLSKAEKVEYVLMLNQDTSKKINHGRNREG